MRFAGDVVILFLDCRGTLLLRSIDTVFSILSCQILPYAVPKLMMRYRPSRRFRRFVHPSAARRWARENESGGSSTKKKSPDTKVCLNCMCLSWFSLYVSFDYWPFAFTIWLDSDAISKIHKRLDHARLASDVPVTVGRHIIAVHVGFRKRTKLKRTSFLSCELAHCMHT